MTIVRSELSFLGRVSEMASSPPLRPPPDNEAVVRRFHEMYNAAAVGETDSDGRTGGRGTTIPFVRSRRRCH